MRKPMARWRFWVVGSRIGQDGWQACANLQKACSQFAQGAQGVRAGLAIFGQQDALVEAADAHELSRHGCSRMLIGRSKAQIPRAE